MRLKFYVFLSALFCSFLFMNSAYSQSVNLALGKTSTASSIEADDPLFIPDSAFNGVGHDISDGNPNDGKARYGSPAVEYRRWSSKRTDAQWVAVDLGARYEIQEVKLYWEVANGKDFTIDVSDDGVSWTTVHTVTGNPTSTFVNVLDISPDVPARYVRMNGTKRNTVYGYSLYEFEVWGLNSILPITLTDFTAQKKENAVQLSWNASMDTESRFNIQRSGNGADFTTIGTLHFPTGTNGISNQYGYTDDAPLPGLNYYRLEYTETGEKTLYSDVLTVRFAEAQSFRISPNPVAGNSIRIELGNKRDAQFNLRLLTITGKLVDQQQVNSQSGTLALKLKKHLSAGTYFLQVLDGNRKVQTKQIIINR